MDESTQLRHGRHVVSNLHVHLVFVTKYRRRVFSAEHLEFMRGVLLSVCDDLGADLVEFNGEEEHVHLLVEYPPSVAVSSLVNSLKGVSSRMVRKEFPSIPTHRKHLWSPSYFASSCGGAPLSVLRTYIENQRTPVRSLTSP